MTSIDRRRFLGVGALGLGYGLTAPVSSRAQNSAPHATRSVRMVGDGLGLTPRDTTEIWQRLAADDRIVGDDYSNGGAVERLEAACAEQLGKERAVFMPTGTLANHLAVRTLAGGAGRAVVQAESHLYNDSGDCVQTLSGMPLIPLGAGGASFTLAELEAALDRTASGRVATAVPVISIETPVRRRFGETFDRAELARIVAFAREHDIRLHLDGARLFLQAAYERRPVTDYTAPFDTVYVSLYKYFNAPSGAILAGPRALLDPMYHTRRMFGAGLPSAWPFAVIAHHYLDGFLDRYRAAIDAAERWISQIRRHDAFTVDRTPGATNLFRLRVAGVDPAAFRRRLDARGVTLGAARGDGRVLVAVNETWTRRPADELAADFVAAVG